MCYGIPLPSQQHTVIPVWDHASDVGCRITASPAVRVYLDIVPSTRRTTLGDRAFPVLLQNTSCLAELSTDCSCLVSELGRPTSTELQSPTYWPPVQPCNIGSNLLIYIVNRLQTFPLPSCILESQWVGCIQSECISHCVSVALCHGPECLHLAPR